MEGNECVEFSHEGKKLLGIVLKHYTLPLADFFLIYADHTIFEWHNKDEYSILIENTIIVACDEALKDVELKRQHLEDIAKFNNLTNSIIDGVQNMDRSLIPF